MGAAILRREIDFVSRQGWPVHTLDFSSLIDDPVSALTDLSHFTGIPLSLIQPSAIGIPESMRISSENG